MFHEISLSVEGFWPYLYKKKQKYIVFHFILLAFFNFAVLTQEIIIKKLFKKIFHLNNSIPSCILDGTFF